MHQEHSPRRRTGHGAVSIVLYMMHVQHAHYLPYKLQHSMLNLDAWRQPGKHASAVERIPVCKGSHLQVGGRAILGDEQGKALPAQQLCQSQPSTQPFMAKVHGAGAH